MKTLKYLTKFSESIIDLLDDLKDNNKDKIGFSIKVLKRYCCYDSRKKRLNFEQQIISILA